MWICERRRTKIERTQGYGVKKIAEKRSDETKTIQEKICLNNWNEVTKDFIRFFDLKYKDTLIKCGVGM